MRQTPFGVWNDVLVRAVVPRLRRSNEADAFWRLEWRISLRRTSASACSNEADAFWRLEYRPSMPPFRPRATRSNEADAFWRLESAFAGGGVRARHSGSNEADAFWRLESFGNNNVSYTTSKLQ